MLFYFLGRNDASPFNAERYQAVCGAHITHMLRDLLDDIDHGYINLPEEILDAQSISLDDLHSREFRMWVLERVRLAQHCFTVGRRYFSRVKDFRCRLAAYAYLARFEWVLKTIEHEGYILRRSYPERKSWRAAVWMGWTVLRSALNLPVREDGDSPLAYPINGGMMKSKSVVIIGAGVGGISAAIHLAQHGFHVTVYEKNPHAGGRCDWIERDGGITSTPAPHCWSCILCTKLNLRH